MADDTEVLDDEDEKEDEPGPLDDEESSEEIYPGGPSLYAPTGTPQSMVGPRNAPRSITGLPPLVSGGEGAAAAARGAVKPPMRSITGLPALNAAPPKSITGMAPMVPTPPPEQLTPQGGNTIAGVAPAASGPDLAQDTISGNVQAPQWKDYKPAHTSLARKLLAGGIGGLAGIKNPELGESAARSILYGPQLADYGADLGEYRGALGQGKLQQAVDLAKEKSELTSSQANLRDQQAAQFDLVPIKMPDGSEVQVQRKDAEKMQAALTANATKKETTESTNQTKEDVAGAQNVSKEKVAQLADETRKLIASEHEAGANSRAALTQDPDKLTNTMKTMKQQAQATLPGIDRAIQETQQVKDLLGPGAGRWNDFMQGKIGAGDPRFAHYKDEIGLVSTAVALAHARGRMSNQLYEHFQQMFDAGKQNADNMTQALDVAKEWLTDYASMGQGGRLGGAEAGPSGTGKLSADEARAYLANAGGDKDKARKMAEADKRTF